MKNTDFRRGQVWWVNHDPSLGSEPAMTRPSLIVSNDDHNQVMPTITVCPITSSIKRVYGFEVFLPEGEGGVPKDSKVQPQLVRTISKERFIESIGQASQETLELVDAALKLHLGIE